MDGTRCGESGQGVWKRSLRNVFLGCESTRGIGKMVSRKDGVVEERWWCRRKGGVEGNGDGEVCCGCLQVGIGKEAKKEQEKRNLTRLPTWGTQSWQGFFSFQGASAMWRVRGQAPGQGQKARRWHRQPDRRKTGPPGGPSEVLRRSSSVPPGVGVVRQQPGSYSSIQKRPQDESEWCGGL